MKPHVLTASLFLVLLNFSQAQHTDSLQTISSFTKTMKKEPGFFPFYYDGKTDKIFLEVQKLDSEFLYFTSLADGVGSGGPERGQTTNVLAKFQKFGPRILLIEPNMTFRTSSTNPDQKSSVDAGFAKSVVLSFTPLAYENGSWLIDLTDLFVRDELAIGKKISSIQRSYSVTRRSESENGNYTIDPARSAMALQHTKNFPANTEFEMMTTFAASSGDPKFGGVEVAPDNNSITVRIHRSFARLPENGYRPRKFDPRSGFGMFSFYDFGAAMSEPLIKRFIVRHRLQKKDPSAAVSEPVKPIIYYVDRGAPDNIKKALIEGGNWWRSAFEAAGFKHAFFVRELPEGADPMDIRYNMVNWITRKGIPRDYSYGASYIDPRTGEILKGVVTLGSDRHRQDYLIAEGLLQPYEDGKAASNQMEELALARIRQLSAHEIGHTLGFEHNFAASPKDRASVMDYPYPRYVKKAGKVQLEDVYAKGIGTWDTRAVVWGYSQFKPGAAEDEELDKIMQSTLKQGFQYIPDIGGYAHPNANQWDDGKNAVDQLNKLMDVRQTLLDNFSEKAIPDQMPLATIQEVLVPIYLLHRYQVEAAAKSIGGFYFTFAIKGDAQLPTKMVEPAEQWRAMTALLTTITPKALSLPETLIRKIPPRPEGYPGGLEVFSSNTGPGFDPIAAAETAASTTIEFLLNPERAARLIEFHGRDPRQPGFFAIADTLINNTWHQPLQEGYNGLLQVLVNNLTLKYLLQLGSAATPSEIVRGQAIFEIQQLKKWLERPDDYASPEAIANKLFALTQIEAFTRNPEKFSPAPSFPMPPGAPIGMP